MGFTAWALGLGLRCRLALGLGFTVQGLVLGFRVDGLGFKLLGLRFRVYKSGGFGVYGFGFRVWGAGLWLRAWSLRRPRV